VPSACCACETATSSAWRVTVGRLGDDLAVLRDHAGEGKFALLGGELGQFDAALHQRDVACVAHLAFRAVARDLR
jgi:hypothetical protein